MNDLLVGQTTLVLCIVLLLQLSKHGEAWTTTAAPKFLSIPRSRVTLEDPRARSTFYKHKHQRRPTWCLAEGSNGASSDAIAQEAKILQERARQARETADEMERDLVASKLKKLEGLLERQSQLSRADEKDIQDRIDSLKNYFNRTSTVVVASETERAELLEQAMDADKGKDDKEKDNEEEKEEILLLSELSEEDRKILESSKEQVKDIIFFFNDILKESVGNNTELMGDNEEIFQELEELEMDLNEFFGDNITKEELEGIKAAQSFFSWLANFTEPMGLNASFWEGVKKNVTSDLALSMEEYKNDPNFAEKLQIWQETLPEKIFNNKLRLSEADMEEFVDRVMLPLNGDVFRLQNVTAKRLSDMHILRGEAIMKSGDDIIRCIDAQMAEVGLQDKFQCYYVKDSTVLLESEGEIDEDVITGKLMERVGDDPTNLFPELLGVVESLADPALIVTSAQVDLSPETGSSERALISSVALVSTAAFAVGCYTQELNLLEQITMGVTSPIFLGILGIQMIHELGHFIAASLNKIEIALPFAMIPSPSTGLVNTNTQLKTPPKNNDALFDFAASGPILGMAASVAALLAGLQMTSLAKPAEITSLPHLPLQFFQLSKLTSAFIESFLGTDVLLSLDPTSDLVAVHPFVIVGHVGILLNALNLLPSCRTTDGGLMLSAALTRYSTVFGILPFWFNLFVLVQGFRGWEASNLLVLYSLVTILQQPTEIPCRNNVDPAGGLRLPLVVATTVLALVALSPSF